MTFWQEINEAISQLLGVDIDDDDK